MNEKLSSTISLFYTVKGLQFASLFSACIWFLILNALNFHLATMILTSITVIIMIASELYFIIYALMNTPTSRAT